MCIVVVLFNIIYFTINVIDLCKIQVTVFVLTIIYKHQLHVLVMKTICLPLSAKRTQIGQSCSRPSPAKMSKVRAV